MLETLGPQVTELTRGLSLAHPTWDLFLLLFLAVGTLLYGFALGRDRIIVVMVAMYMALVAVSRLPVGMDFSATVQIGNDFVLRLGVFVGIFITLFLLLTRSALYYALAGFNTLGRWWQSLLLALMQTGLTASVLLSFLPLSFVEKKFAPLTQMIFVSRWGQFAWALLPIIALLIIGQSENRVRERYDR